MSESYDVPIIGSGSAGGVLSARLSEDPERSVLLLEAGPDIRATDLPYEIRDAYGERNIWAEAFGTATQYGWNYRGQATEDSPDMLVPRGKSSGVPVQ